MTELTVTRGKDVELYADGEMLFGVTRLSAVSRYKRHRVYEYLSSAPCADLPAGESHEIEIKVLSLFSGAIPCGGSFTLRVVEGDTEYMYYNSAVEKRDRNVRGDKLVSDIFTLTADRMTKRRISDAE